MKYRVTIEGEEHEVVVQHLPSGAIEVQLDGAPWPGEVRAIAGGVSLKIGHEVIEVLAGGPPERLDLAAGSLRSSAVVEGARSAGRKKRASGGASSNELRAPMPGRIVKILVQSGATVEPGDALVVIEAMKMENELRAERAGEIAAIEVKEGQNVEGNAVLLRFA